MEEVNAQGSTDRPVDLEKLVAEACETDDVSLMERAISLASHPNSRPRWTAQDVIELGLRYSAARGAIQVLQYLLDRGADVGRLQASTILNINDRPSEALLDILIDHGWDINIQSDRRRPLLWLITRHHDLVVWCLDHGARVDIPDSPPSHRARSRPTLLEVAAGRASVETFELLRARNAPLHPRALHLAVEQAVLLAPEESSSGNRSPRPGGGMAMVRHLVDVLKLDVNALARMPRVPAPLGTPLCIPASRPTKQDYRELIDFLLNRGADPNMTGARDDAMPDRERCKSPIGMAEACRNERFLKIVREWQASHESEDHTDQRKPITS